VSRGQQSSSIYDEEDIPSMGDMEEPAGIHGLVQVQGLVKVDGLVKINGMVQVGAPQTAAQLLAQAVSEIKAHTGWDDATVKALIANGHTPAEAKQLTARHAQVARAGVRGLVSVGSMVTVSGKWSPFDKFFSQFDPTWPKAKFGGMIRAAITDAAAIVGIPAGPIMDGIAAIHVQMVGGGSPHPAAMPGPLPPMPRPVGLSPMAMEHHRKRWTTGEKVVAVAVVGTAGWFLYRWLNPKRASNPRRRRKNPRRKRKTNARKRRR
jgi:hypothetical protein